MKLVLNAEEFEHRDGRWYVNGHLIESGRVYFMGVELLGELLCVGQLRLIPHDGYFHIVGNLPGVGR